MLFAMQNTRHPPGRFLILSDNLALVLALCKGRSNKFKLLSVMRRIFVSGIRAGFIFVVQMGTFRELNFSVDRDYDSIKSLLHVLAQRSARSLPAQTCTSDCFSPSFMHLDDGGIDPTSHIHVPAVECFSHKARPMFSLIAMDTQPVSHLKSPPSLARMTGSAARCLMVPVLR